MMKHEEGEPGVCSVLPIRPPRHSQTFADAPHRVLFRSIERVPALIAGSRIELEHLAQVVTKGGDEAGILPAGTITGTTKTIDTAVWLTLHENIALELLECSQTNLNRVLIQAALSLMMVIGAGWQVADHTVKPSQQPLSQRLYLRVEGEPIENLLGQ